MSDDPYQDPQWLEYADHVKKELIPKIKDSAVAMALMSGSDPDPKQAVELGYMILLDKPIITVVLPGVKIPGHLARVSDAIVEADMDDPKGTSARIAAAMQQIDATKVEN